MTTHHRRARRPLNGLDHAWEPARSRCCNEGWLQGPYVHHPAVMDGAVWRVRPKTVTVVAIIAGLQPTMWGSGRGSEVMSRIAVPMVGGMISSMVLTLCVIPRSTCWSSHGNCGGNPASPAPRPAPL